MLYVYDSFKTKIQTSVRLQRFTHGVKFPMDLASYMFFVCMFHISTKKNRQSAVCVILNVVVFWWWWWLNSQYKGVWGGSTTFNYLNYTAN
jgi:hypothetical protein